MHIDRLERNFLIVAAAVLAVFFASVVAAAVIFGVRPPTTLEMINPQNLAETRFAQPGVRSMGNGRYEAYVVAQMWSFDAGSTDYDDQGTQIVRVPRGAEVTFYVTSRDVQHGFIVEEHNLNLQLVPGQVAMGTLHFNRAGTFRVLCHEYCGRGHQAMHFAIIVEDAPAD